MFIIVTYIIVKSTRNKDLTERNYCGVGELKDKSSHNKYSLCSYRKWVKIITGL
jgi:hypothetical protein